MNLRRLAVLTILATRALAAEDPPNPKLVPPAPLHEQVLHVPGDPDRPVSLVVTLYTPDGPGPFPLVVMNHGSTGNREARAQAPRYRFTMSAYYFLSRGYAVALPMMRGYAGSGGEQGDYGCNLTQMAEDNGRDILAVITNLSSDKLLDTRRVVVAGQSFGGWNTLGVGSLQPRNVRGLIDFFGGVQSSACNRIENDADALARAAGRMGNTTLVPSLWFYGENDSLFGPDTWHAMHDAYVAHGADVELVDVGSFMEDSHQMLSRPESVPVWTPRVDAFLARIGMPSRAVFPQYLPVAWPKPTHFADVADIGAVPWVTPQSRQVYAKFLTMPMPRVFDIAVGGQAATAQGGFDPVARAAQMCREKNLVCVPYAIDSDVVFRPPPSAAPVRATGFADIGDVGAVPWVNDKGRATYRTFLAHASPRAFVIGTGGENAAIFGPPDPLGRAMALCANAHVECRPYAVGDSVVWVAPPAPPRPPRPSHFAKLADASAVPFLTEHGRAAYLHFLTEPLPRAFAVAPGGQSVVTQGGYDPAGRALAKCRQAGLSCSLYAVDGDVVWR